MHCMARHGMAYYIFPKSLRSLEEFRKNSHIKSPPKSPCTNFQSLVNSKFQFSFWKEFLFSFLPSRPSRPAVLFCLLAHSAYPGLFFLLPPETEERPRYRLLPPSSAAPTSPAMESMPRAVHRLCRLFPPPPLFTPWIKHHLKSSCFIPINHQPFLHLNHRLPPSRSAPIQRESPAILHRTSPRSSSLLSVPKRRPHPAPPLPLLHRHHPVATPSPMLRWGPRWTPRAPLFLLHHRRWAAMPQSGRSARFGEPPWTSHGPVDYGPVPSAVHGWWTESTIFSHWKIIPY
jgi:hypothetical protein